MTLMKIILILIAENPRDVDIITYWDSVNFYWICYISVTFVSIFLAGRIVVFSIKTIEDMRNSKSTFTFSSRCIIQAEDVQRNHLSNHVTQWFMELWLAFSKQNTPIVWIFFFIYPSINALNISSPTKYSTNIQKGCIMSPQHWGCSVSKLFLQFPTQPYSCSTLLEKKLRQEGENNLLHSHYSIQVLFKLLWKESDGWLKERKAEADTTNYEYVHPKASLEKNMSAWI